MCGTKEICRGCENKVRIEKIQQVWKIWCNGKDSSKFDCDEDVKVTEENTTTTTETTTITSSKKFFSRMDEKGIAIYHCRTSENQLSLL